ncbi:MAG: uroporphyrinogen-III C-methyltransferase [Propionibacteriaceae bacterium]|nr:uroporphyrinogen-III C-methyltransferase [Propionibacteriaceae bacterium]
MTTRQRESGRVTLIGGGPGNAGLITVAGMDALQRADVVVFDRLAPLSLLQDLPARLIDVGKIPHGPQTAQEAINEILITEAGKGLDVVRLKGGDSFVFGRGSEEWRACTDAGIAVEIIPGVSSAIAAPELAGIPVTHRGLTQGFTVVSGHVPPGDPRCTLNWPALANTGTTLVVLMGVKNLAPIAAELVAHGLAAETPAAVIADAGLPSQKVVRASVEEIAGAASLAGIAPPAVTVIGDVAGLDLG